MDDSASENTKSGRERNFMAKGERSVATDTLVKKIMDDIQQLPTGSGTMQLPPEPELMATYQVTRYTLRQALKNLSQMGYTFQAHGIGTFVRPRMNNHAISLQNPVGMTDEMARQGRHLTTKHATILATTVAEAAFLPIGTQLDSRTPLWSVRRFRYADDKPFIFEQSYYLRNIVHQIPETALYGSLFNFVEENDSLKVGFQDTIIEAGSMSQEMAGFFDRPEQSPTLSVRDDSYLSSGQLFAFSKLGYDARDTKLFLFKKI